MTIARTDVQTIIEHLADRYPAVTLTPRQREAYVEDLSKLPRAHELSAACTALADRSDDFPSAPAIRNAVERLRHARAVGDDPATASKSPHGTTYLQAIAAALLGRPCPVTGDLAVDAFAVQLHGSASPGRVVGAEG